MPRLRISVQIEGMLSIHAVRAVRTALGAVPGVVAAEVSLKGAVLDTEGPIDRALLDAALEMAGVRVVSISVDKAPLPVL